MKSHDDFKRLTAKLERAAENIRNLEAALDAFFIEHPNTPIRDTDPQSGEIIFKAHGVVELDPIIRAIIGDVLFDVRSSLDHLANWLIENNGGKVTNSTEFPIAKSLKEYQTTDFQERKIGKITQPVKDIFDEIKPYKGGDRNLWILHELNRRDKHRLLLTASLSNLLQSMLAEERESLRKNFLGGIDADLLDPSDFLTEPTESHVPLKNGDIIARFPKTQAHEDLQIVIDVVFNEPDILRPEHVVTVLKRIEQSAWTVFAKFGEKDFI